MMIAAMAAAVSATSTLRLMSDPEDLVSAPAGAGFAGKLTLVYGAGPLEGLEVETGFGTGSAGPAKATGLTKATWGVGAAGGPLLAGALWRPIE